MKQDKHDMQPTVSARRRLIRGAFAAPAAMTLLSGSVAARSAINCVTKRVSSPELPALAAAEGTTYVRVQLRKFTGSAGGNVKSNRTSRWVRGSDIVGKQAAGSSVYLTGTQWQLYDRDTTGATSSCDITSTNFNPASAYAGALTPPGTIVNSTPTENGSVVCDPVGGSSPKSIDSTSEVGDQWVAIRVNSAGDILGVAGLNDPATGQSAVWQSCWTSFRLG